MEQDMKYRMLRNGLLGGAAVFLLGALIALAQYAPDRVITMVDDEVVALVCADFSLHAPPGDTAYVTCNQAVDVPPTEEPPTVTPIPTDEPTATNEPPLPTATNTPSGYPDPPTPEPTETPGGYPVDPTNTPQPTATNTPLPPTATAQPTGAERGRVQIVWGGANGYNGYNVVADNGEPLRGEHMVLSDHDVPPDDPDIYSINAIYSDAYWRELRDNYRLNIVRLLAYREPQQGTCLECFPLDHVFFNEKTTLEIMDEAVNKAAEMGMYIVIDYHPVGGHDMSDFYAWWDVVAPRYKNRTHVIYEAANEPVVFNTWTEADYTPQDIADISAMYQHLRTLAPDTHIILWTFPQGDDNYLAVVPQGQGISYQNASVAVHPYGYNRSRVVELREQYPMIFSEVGHNRDLATENHELIGASWIWLDGVLKHTPGEIVTWQADPAAVDR
jgi:hypothetical protein